MSSRKNADSSRFAFLRDGRAATLAAAAFAVAGLTLLAFSAESPAAKAVQIVTALLGLAALLLGPWKNKPSDKVAWSLIATGGFTYLISDTVRGLVTPDNPLWFIPEGISILAYTALFAGVVRMTWRRGLFVARGEALDLIVVGLAVWTGVWVIFLDPILSTVNLPAAAIFLNVLYPCLSAAVLFATLLLAGTAPKGARTSGTALALGMGSLAIADLTWSTTSIGQAIQVGTFVADHRLSLVMYSAAFVFCGAAALMPGMRALTHRDTHKSPASTPSRMALVAASLLVPPAAYLTRYPETTTGKIVIGTIAVAMTFIVIARVINAIRLYSTVEQRLFWQAHHDNLTAMPNRALLTKELDTLLAARTTPVAVAFFDLDRFKSVNDTYGHAVGDELLKAVTARVRATIRTNDILSRVSGDEFIAVLPGVRNATEAAAVGKLLLNAFQEPFQLSIGTLTASTSIGVTVATTAQPTTSDRLLIEADHAMYRSKAQGRNMVTVFDNDMAEAADRRVQLEKDLRDAATNGELTMVYQPIIDLATGTVDGFEALTRWTHPTFGPVSPAEFVPLAEETGQIITLGRWTFQTAIAQLAQWQKQSPKLTMAINLSARQLRDTGLVTHIEQTLHAHGVLPTSVILEVTETAMLVDADHADHVFTDLKALGVGLALDDFGTGYSSMSFISRYPVNEVKIDRSFVSGLGENAESKAICAAVLVLAHKLGLDVVGEGIETVEQLEHLRSLGCAKGQGWHFSKALTATEVNARGYLANTAATAIYETE